MVRRKGEFMREEKFEMRGGKGAIGFEHLLESEKGEFHGTGRLFSVITVAPGDSIGYHVHEGDMEFYYVLSGEGKYNDDGIETVIKEGDFTITYDGSGHSLENSSDKDLIFIALVLFTK